MEAIVGATVECVDGEAGRIEGLVLERQSMKLSGLVVAPVGIPPANLVVPMDVVRNAEARRVYLRLTTRELREQVPQSERNRLRSRRGRLGAAAPGSPEELVITSTPAIGSEPPLIPVQSDLSHPFLLREVTNIDNSAVVVTKLTQILCPEGLVGTFAGILFDPTTNKMQHMLVRLNPPSRSSVRIPAYLISYVEENEVYVKARQTFIESLAA